MWAYILSVMDLAASRRYHRGNYGMIFIFSHMKTDHSFSLKCIKSPEAMRTLCHHEANDLRSVAVFNEELSEQSAMQHPHPLPFNDA